MARILALLAFLILLNVQAFCCGDVYALQSSESETASEVPEGVVDDYYGAITENLVNWMEINGRKLNKQPGYAVPEPGPIAEAPPPPPEGLSNDMKDLFKDYYAYGNTLAEIDEIYNSNIPSDIKFMELQEKSNSLAERGYIEKKEQQGWASGAMGRLKGALEKAPSLPSMKDVKRKMGVGAEKGSQAEGEGAGVDVEKSRSSGLTVYRIYSKGAGPDGEKRWQTVTLRPGGEKLLSEEEVEKMIEMKLPGSREWVPLYEGEDIPEGAIIYTGHGPTVLQDENGNFYKIRPVTKVDVGRGQHQSYKISKEELESDLP